jgi:RNA binding exosome subunit
MQAHLIELSVFSAPEDNLEKISNSFLSFLPFDPAEEKVPVKRLNAEGFNDRKIVILSVTLSKQRHITAFLKSLFSRLSPDQKELVANQKESRVDDNLYFYMRFDKAKLMEGGKLWLTDCGSCFHLKISLAPFPRKKELALKIVDELLAQNSK